MPPGSAKPSMILSSAMTERKDKDMTDSMEKLAGVTPDMEKRISKAERNL